MKHKKKSAKQKAQDKAFIDKIKTISVAGAKQGHVCNGPKCPSCGKPVAGVVLVHARPHHDDSGEESLSA